MQRVALLFAAFGLFATGLGNLLFYSLLAWGFGLEREDWELAAWLVLLCLATLAVGIFTLRLSKRTTPGGRWQPLATLLWLAAMALLTFLAFVFLGEWYQPSFLGHAEAPGRYVVSDAARYSMLLFAGLCLASAAGSAWGLARRPDPVPAGVVLFLAYVLSELLEAPRLSEWLPP